jgi:multiple sugar transport system permease protein
MSAPTTDRTAAGADVAGRRTPARRKDPRKKLLALFAGYAVLVTFSVIYIYPFIIQLSTSFKTNQNSTGDPLGIIPDPVTTAAFERLSQTDFPLWFVNSVIIAVCVTAGRVFFNSLAGYALARIKFKGRDAVFTAILAVLAVPGVILLIPKFLVLNYLGIWDSYPALVVPLLVDAAGVFIMKQFFESIPVSVEEAARIDGASTFRIFWSVVLPMAKPALITITILSFQGSWNELPHFIVAAQDPALNNLTKGVATLVTGQLGSGQQYPLTMAAALLMTIPTVVLFFSLQRYFVRGGTAGAEKG